MTESRWGSPFAAPSPGSLRGRPLVLLDTNALFLPFRDRFPLLAEIERWAATARIAVARSTLSELERLVARGAPAAEAAREFARRFPLVSSVGPGDLALLRVAVRRRAAVVTSDRALRARLLAAGVPVLSPRSGSRLQLSLPAPGDTAGARRPPRSVAPGGGTGHPPRQRRPRKAGGGG